MKMKRKRRSNSDKMEEMAFIKATTKLRSEVQYLGTVMSVVIDEMTRNISNIS